MNALHSYSNNITNPFASKSFHRLSFPASIPATNHIYHDHKYSERYLGSIDLLFGTTPETYYTVLADLISTITYSLCHSTVLGFTSSSGVSADFREYCRGLLRRAQLSTRVIIVGLHYLNRLCQHAPRLCSQVGLEPQLLTVSMLLGMKYHEDVSYNNSAWNKMSGIPISVLNNLEMKFLEILEFDLYFSEGDYEVWIQQLEAMVRTIRNPFANLSQQEYTPRTPVKHRHSMPLMPQQFELPSSPEQVSSKEPCGCELDACNDLVPCPLHMSEYPSLL
ncbi:hypothetical protein K7432_007773 [Basidiobolus ranarum]|uniref:Cyclin N-terminal domain-containing protein n=1 Tax=Basidiobolus ranarum TaxID=34480 RepID=A0ABR2WSU0_9FUNG